jgi:hypothetical protein
MFLKVKLQVDGGEGIVTNISDVKKVLGEGCACVRYADSRDSDGVEMATRFMKLERHLQMLQSWDKAFVILSEGNSNAEWGCNLFVEVGKRGNLREKELVEEKLRYLFERYLKNVMELFSRCCNSISVECSGAFGARVIRVTLVFMRVAIEIRMLKKVFDVRVVLIAILFAYALMKYCSSKSLEDVKKDGWGGFEKFVDNLMVVECGKNGLQNLYYSVVC